MQQHIKRIMHHDLVDFIPAILIGLTPEYNAIHPINKIKNKNDIIISVDIEKTLKNILHHFLMELLNKLRTEGNFLNMTKDKINEQLVDSLQGNMREIIGTITLKDLCNDRSSLPTNRGSLSYRANTAARKEVCNQDRHR